MRTIDISPEDMEKRVSRIQDLKPLQAAATHDMPQDAKDVIYSREISSVNGLEGAEDTPESQGATGQDAVGINMTQDHGPPHTGAPLHPNHQH